MNPPDFFLADLPPDAMVTPQLVLEACQTLKRNRERYLTGRSTASMVRVLAEVGSNWMREDYPLRRLALEEGPKHTGFSKPTLMRGLDSFFGQLTEANLNALIEQELGHPQRLDRMVSSVTEHAQNTAALAVGPELLVHITAGNVPNPALMSMVLGLLVRSAQFVKCASGASYLPRLLGHAIYETDPKLGSCLEIAEWRGGMLELESQLYREASCVTATGSDETLEAIRRQLPSKVRFLGYGHRLSFSFVSSELFGGSVLRKVLAAVADDIVAWDQLGCLSPHVIFVEGGGNSASELFAQMLAEELELREQTEPRGKLKLETAAVIANRRAFYEVRAAASTETRMWCSPNSTAWTVVHEMDPRFQVSCLHRFVYVKPVKSLQEALEAADSVRGRVSAVGLAVQDSKAADYAEQLARWGVSRVCPVGRMQTPPLTWRHDGRPALGDLVMWTNWER